MSITVTSLGHFTSGKLVYRDIWHYGDPIETVVFKSVVSVFLDTMKTTHNGSPIQSIDLCFQWYDNRPLVSHDVTVNLDNIISLKLLESNPITNKVIREFTYKKA